MRGRLLKIAQLEGEKYVFLEQPEAILQGLRNSDARVDLFTFMQRLPDTTPKYTYPMEWDNFAALPVSTYDHWWKEQIGYKARNKAKQAEKKGVVLREVTFDETLAQGICTVYNESPVRQGHRNTHYGKDVQTVYREAATFLDCSVFVGAYLGAELVGFIKMVIDESRTQAGLLNIVSMVKHRDKAPTNALIAAAVRCCAERRIPYLVYSNFAYGKRQTSTLSDFKERNGFQKIEVPRYYVPLTPAGKLALQFGLHHRLADHVPESVAAKLRDLRTAWYNRKFSSMTEA
ncbi:MAG TPA: hypothetical protein VN841_22925 [Bryobacteraceae bacterium]|nr:hypothetical protein [Bryobacteraceae bacterium]